MSEYRRIQKGEKVMSELDKMLLNEEELEKVNGGTFIEEAVDELLIGFEMGIGDGCQYYIKIEGGNQVYGPYMKKERIISSINILKRMGNKNIKIIKVRPGETVG